MLRLGVTRRTGVPLAPGKSRVPERRGWQNFNNPESGGFKIPSERQKRAQAVTCCIEVRGDLRPTAVIRWVAPDPASML